MSEENCNCGCKDPVGSVVPENIIFEIRRASVKPGDVLHVKLGIMDMGDGQPPWIPGDPECEHTKKEIEAILPEGVTAYVTHFGVEIDTVVRPEPQEEFGLGLAKAFRELVESDDETPWLPDIAEVEAARKLLREERDEPAE